MKYLVPLLLLISVCSCSPTLYPTTIKTVYLPENSFSWVRTYALGTTMIQSPEDFTFKYVQFHDRVVKEIMFQMPNIGIRPSQIGDQNPADITIYYFLYSDKMLKMPLGPYNFGILNDDVLDAEPNTLDPDKGILVIDFVQTQRNDLLWRGMGTISIDDPSNFNKQLGSTIYQILRAFNE